MAYSIWDTNNQASQVNPITGLPAVNNQLTSQNSIWGDSGNPFSQGDTNTIAGISGTDTNNLSTLGDTGSFWNNANTWGNISQGIGAVGSLANTYLGFQQLGQAEDQLAFQKEAFWSNYNQQVADREESARRRAIASTGEDPSA